MIQAKILQYSLLFAAVLFSLASSQSNNFTLYLLKGVENALCLDGSKPGFYYYQGTETNKWVIFFEGGGWCGMLNSNQTLADCYARSQTDLGSSNGYPASLSFNGQGILSPLSSENKYYHNYNKVYLKYCDGAGFQGYNQNPVEYQYHNLWFRGYINTNETINYLISSLGLNQAQEVVVSGCSAGALASFYWIDNIAQRFDQTKVKLYGVADTGIFLDVPDPVTQQNNLRSVFQNFMQYSNPGFNVVSKACYTAYPTQQWKCMFFQYLYPYIQTPVFMSMSEYDPVSIMVILNITCALNLTLTTCTSTERQYIESYRSSIMTVFNQALTLQPSFGIWSPACLNHCFCQSQIYNNHDYEVPELSWNTVEESLVTWKEGLQKSFIDTVNWPNNRPCSNDDVNFFVEK